MEVLQYLKFYFVVENGDVGFFGLILDISALKTKLFDSRILTEGVCIIYTFCLGFVLLHEKVSNQKCCDFFFFFKIFLPLQLKVFAIAVPPFVHISVLIIFNMF